MSLQPGCIQDNLTQTLLAVFLGWVHRLHCTPAVGDLGGPRPPRRPGHPRHPRGQQRLVPVADPRQPGLLLQRHQGGGRGTVRVPGGGGEEGGVGGGGAGPAPGHAPGGGGGGG